MLKIFSTHGGNMAPVAIDSFINSLRHLKENFGLRSSGKFFNSIDELLQNIKTNPKFYSVSIAQPNYRKAVIHKRTVIYYQMEVNLFTSTFYPILDANIEGQAQNNNE